MIIDHILIPYSEFSNLLKKYQVEDCLYPLSTRSEKQSPVISVKDFLIFSGFPNPTSLEEIARQAIQEELGALKRVSLSPLTSSTYIIEVLAHQSKSECLNQTFKQNPLFREVFKENNQLIDEFYQSLVYDTPSVIPDKEYLLTLVNKNVPLISYCRAHNKVRNRTENLIKATGYYNSLVLEVIYKTQDTIMNSLYNEERIMTFIQIAEEFCDATFDYTAQDIILIH